MQLVMLLLYLITIITINIKKLVIINIYRNGLHDE